MSTKNKRLLVFIVNSIILILNSLITFIEQSTDKEIETALLYESDNAIVREYVRG